MSILIKQLTTRINYKIPYLAFLEKRFFYQTRDYQVIQSDYTGLTLPRQSRFTRSINARRAFSSQYKFQRRRLCRLCRQPRAPGYLFVLSSRGEGETRTNDAPAERINMTR